MPLVVELEERWAVGMVLLEVEVVDLGLAGGVAALLTHVHLVTENSALDRRRLKQG